MRSSDRAMLPLIALASAARAHGSTAQLRAMSVAPHRLQQMRVSRVRSWMPRMAEDSEDVDFATKGVWYATELFGKAAAWARGTTATESASAINAGSSTSLEEVGLAFLNHCE